MEEVSDLDKFDADLDGINEEEDGDPAAAVEPPTGRQRRGDLPQKELLKIMLSEAVEASTRAATEKRG